MRSNGKNRQPKESWEEKVVPSSLTGSSWSSFKNELEKSAFVTERVQVDPEMLIPPLKIVKCFEWTCLFLVFPFLSLAGWTMSNSRYYELFQSRSFLATKIGKHMGETFQSEFYTKSSDLRYGHKRSIFVTSSKHYNFSLICLLRNPSLDELETR